MILSIYISIPLSIYFSSYPHLSLCISLYIYLSMSLYLFIFLSFSILLNLSHIFTCISLSPYLYLFSLSFYFSISISTSLYFPTLYLYPFISIYRYAYIIYIQLSLYVSEIWTLLTAIILGRHQLVQPINSEVQSAIHAKVRNMFCFIVFKFTQFVALNFLLHVYRSQILKPALVPTLYLFSQSNSVHDPETGAVIPKNISET